MARAGRQYDLPPANAHTELNTATEQTLTLEKSTVAVMLGARGAAAGDTVSVTFNNTAASATNGIGIIAKAQPVLIPLGYLSDGTHVLRALGPASSFLDVLQLS